MPADTKLEMARLPNVRWAVATGLLGVLLASLVQPIAARRWRSEDFEQYVLAYRVVAVLQPVALLGLSVSLPRWMARQDGRDTSAIARSGLLVVAVSICAVAVVVTALPTAIGTELTGLPFSARQRVDLIVLIAGLLLAAVATATVRGNFNPTLGAALQALAVAVFPLVAVSVSGDALTALQSIGRLSLVSSLIVLVGYHSRAERRQALRRVDNKRVITWAGVLVRYGVRRVPGEFSIFGIFAITPLAYAVAGQQSTAADVAVACSLVVGLGAAVAPLSDAAMPNLSLLQSRGALSTARSSTLVVILGLAVMTISSALLFMFGADLISVYLGRSVDSAVELRLVAASTGSYVIYVASRSVIDASNERPTSMRIAALSGIPYWLTLIAALLVRQEELVAVGFLVFAVLLGSLALYEVHMALSRNASRESECTAI